MWASAVVFSRTEVLGDGIPTDDDVGSGAHTTLQDLRLETLYSLRYRVQGASSDAAGWPTFPRRPPALPKTRLHAAGEPSVVDVRSAYSWAFDAETAADGHPWTGVQGRRKVPLGHG